MKKIKPNWKYLILPLALGFTFSSLTAQEKVKNENDFKQPAYIIELDNPNEIQSKSNLNIPQDTQGLFKTFLKLEKGNAHTLIKKETDNLGFIHEKCQQTYKGVPVEFGVAVVSRKNGKAQSIHGEYYNVTNIKTTPSISAGQAFQKAIAHTKAQKYAWQDPTMAKIANYKKPKGELVVLPDLTSKNENGVVTKFNLAYKFDIYALQPMRRGNLYIDAHTGTKLLFDSTISQGCHTHTSHTDGTKASDPVSVLETLDTSNNSSLAMPMAFVDGTADTEYSGRRTISTTRLPNNGNYILHDTSRGDGIHVYNLQSGTDITTRIDFTDNDNNWTSAEHDNDDKDNAALDALWGLSRAYDYFNTVHERNSYDGNGAEITCYVHYGNNYSNGFWSNNALHLGDGSSDVDTPRTSVDWVAHELGHGLDQETSNLTYQGESGALNEGLSDIWGAVVEHFAKGNNNDLAPNDNTWTVFEETSPNGIRSMQNPKLFNHPDTYKGTNWAPTSSSSPDRGGVHTNSGVLNHWFYLVTVGSQNTDQINDHDESFSITGIGMDRATAIVYRAETQYLTSNSDYNAARAAMIRAATDIHGANSTEVETVTAAWHAVGVGLRSDNEYCSAVNSNTFGLYHISNVRFGSINKNSGRNGYSDFSTESTNLDRGTSPTISITLSSSTFLVLYKVYIDYNQNNVFEENEVVLSTTELAQGSLSATAINTVPQSARLGRTRMRVIAASSERFLIPCNRDAGLNSNREVEDYSVVIREGSTTSPTCNDNIQNGDETGVDCGGSSCSACDDTTTDPVEGGNVVFVDMADQTANASGTWRSFRIEVGDDSSFGAWFTQNQLRLVANSKDIVCNGTTSNITLIGEGVQVGPNSNFVNNSHSYIVSTSSYTPWRGQSGYIGFRFMINQQVHYGWFHATVANDGLSYTITDYAYNETAGQGLTTTRDTAKSLSHKQQDFIIAPNPVKNGVLNIKTEQVKHKAYRITNMLGQTVQKGPFNASIHVSDLKTGVYSIKIDTTSKLFVIE